MKLYYVTGTWSSLHRVVHANTPKEAVELWAKDVKAWVAWEPERTGWVEIYDLSQTALCPGVMDWDTIPLYKCKVPKAETLTR